MCRPRVLFAAALSGVVLVNALPVYGQSAADRAQSAEQARARLNTRIDSLLPVFRSAIVARDSARDARIEAARAARVVPLDTVGVGPFLVVGTRGAVRATQPRFAEAWKRLEPSLGEHTSGSLSGAVFLVEYGTRSPTLFDLESRPLHYRIWFPGWRGTQWHRNLAATAVGRQITQSLPEDVQRWLGGGTVNDPPGDSYVHRQLRLSRQPVSRTCMDGDVAACLTSLGLAESPAATPPSRMDMHIRSHFLDHALASGGAGSIERLASGGSDASAAQRIADAAATDMPTLVASWLDEVRNAEPDVWAGLGSSGMTTLFWMLVLIALAARSTRWRIG